MSFPEGVGGGFCPRSKVLIPEFSGAPRRDAGVGFCSISPMMKAAYMISAETIREMDQKEGLLSKATNVTLAASPALRLCTR